MKYRLWYKGFKLPKENLELEAGKSGPRQHSGFQKDIIAFISKPICLHTLDNSIIKEILAKNKKTLANTTAILLGV